MKLKELTAILLIGWSAAIVFGTPPNLAAVNFLVSELVTADSTVGGVADSINDLEFLGSGLYWTVPTEFGGVEFSHQGSIGIEGYRLGPFSNPFYPVRGSEEIAYGVRDDSNVYYTSKRGIFRKPIYAGPSDASVTIGGGWNIDEPGALMLWNGRVYCALGNSSVVSGGGFGDSHLAIQYFNAPGLNGPLENPVVTANGSALASDPGAVTKMGVAARHLSGVRSLIPYGIAVTRNGLLLAFDLDVGFFGLGSARVLASDVSDFAIRREEFFEGSGLSRTQYFEDTLYATVGRSKCAGDAPAKIISVNPISGQLSTVWTAPNGASLLALGVDNEYLFVSSIQATARGGPFGGCATIGDGVIRAKKSPASIAFQNASPDPNWDAIESAAGLNLRSDGQHLYFTSGQQVRRMPNNSPRIRLDLAAIGLEAVQTVQDWNNSLPLVEGKTTFVRGYAQIVENSKNLSALRVTARLRAFQDGQELPGSPIFPRNEPLIDATGDRATLRTNLSRSFFFVAPTDWLKPGTVRLQLTVDPFQSLPENSDALANNSFNATIAVVPGRRPSLVFKPMSSTFPNYDPQAPGSGFLDILTRARSLLPVTDFKVYFSPESVTKPVPTLFEGVKGRSFNMPDDKDFALFWMAVAHLLSSDPDPDTHWIGTFPGEVSVFNGIGGARGVKLSDLIDSPPVDISIPPTVYDNTAVVRMSTGQNNSADPWGSIVGGHSLAHELGHNYGRFHIRQRQSCGSNDPARPWDTNPGMDPCTLGITDLNNPSAPIGYDFLTGSLILPNASGDLMSYANSDWTSPHTWNALVNAIPETGTGNPGAGLSAGRASIVRQAAAGFRPDANLNPQPLPPHDPAFIWQGMIRADADSGVLLSGLRLPRGAIDPAKISQSLAAAAAMPADANFRLRLIGDPNAAPLDERPVTLLPAAEGDGKTLWFAQAMPDFPEATQLQLMSGTKVLAQLTASANAPVVGLDAPVFDPIARLLSLSWTASDADQDPLLFTVQFSSDGGTHWQTIKVNDPDLALTVSTVTLSGGDHCLLRVLATDGFQTAIATTSEFVMPRLGPTITVNALVDGQRLPFGTPTPVRLWAYDAEDGSLDDSAFSWTVSGVATLSGVGQNVSIADLPPGPATLTATAMDSDGNATTKTVQFEIQPVLVAGGEAPTLDGIAADPGYVGAAKIHLSSGTSDPTVRFVHQNGTFYASITGLPLSGAGAPPAAVELAIEPTAARNSAPQSADFVFGVDQEGLPSVSEGDGTKFVSTSVRTDFHAAIFRNETSWSAEIAIPDGLIGGWNHDALLAVSTRQFLAILIPFSPPVIVPGVSLQWPPSSDAANPSTWGSAIFGTSSSTALDRPPVSVAFGPGVVSLDSMATLGLNGAGSFDPDGNPLSFAWTQIDGPGVSLQNANTAMPFFTVSVPSGSTALTFQLVVNDGQQDSAPANVSVTLNPVASDPGAEKNAGPAITPGDGTNPLKGHLDWPGPVGSIVSVQASTDLVNWFDLATNAVGLIQGLLFADADAGNYPYRFYRLRDWTAPEATTGGNAFQLDGTDGLVTVPHDDALNALPVTLMAWINTTQGVGAYPGIVTKYLGGQGQGYALALDNGRFDPWYYASPSSHVEELTGAALDGRFVADGLWHHLAYVVTEINAQIYIDGTLMNSLGWIGNPGPVQSSAPLLFGAYRGGSGIPFAGQLDEVAIWNRALSQDEVRAQMHHSASGLDARLIGLWHFDEPAGDTTSDATGHGHEGIISGGVLRLPSTAPVH